MHLPIVSVRYGLMLEAYCRGCGRYREALAKQVRRETCTVHSTAESPLAHKRPDSVIAHLLYLIMYLILLICHV